MVALADSYKLEIEFPTSASFGNALVLDTGTLDSSLNGKLGGNAYADVTADVMNIESSRGRSRQLDQFNSGTLTFTFRNNTRAFDPTNTSGVFFGGIQPRRPVRLSVNSTYIYTGWIDNWNIDYSVPTESRVSASCVDAFSIYASIELDEFTFTNGERTDQRIVSLLALPEMAGVAIATSLESGESTLADDTVSLGTSALDYLQRINQSEQGYLFINGSGQLRFRKRTTSYNASIPVFTDQTPSASEYKYTQVGVQVGAENLYNRVTVTNESGNTQVAENLTSQTDFLVRSLNISDLILENDAQALGIAEFLLGKYQRPEFRFESVTVSFAGLSTVDQNTLIALEPNDLVEVKRNFTTGTPLQVSRYGIIEGIFHTITTTEHIVRFSLSPAQGSLRLDNTTFGILDSNTLGL
jgi:hypothetical protein